MSQARALPNPEPDVQAPPNAEPEAALLPEPDTSGPEVAETVVNEPVEIAGLPPAPPPVSIAPAVRRSRWERYRPRPAVTLVAFGAGIVLGATLFVTRMQPAPVEPQALPASPYLSLPGVGSAPFQVAVLMEGLTSDAALIPNVVPDPALNQLRRVMDGYRAITSVEHQGTIVVDNQAISALVIRGFDIQGRLVATTLTARLVDAKIVEFR